MANGVIFDWKYWLALPTEIAREIFLCCSIHTRRFDSDDALEPGFASYGFCVPSIRHSPLNISHVCRWWRDLALSIPELWASLALVSAFEDPDVVTELCSTWLSRSGVLPLSLAMNPIIRPDQRSDFGERIGYAMLASTLTFIPRWHRIWIHIPRLSSLPPTSNNFPAMLERIHLGVSLLSSFTRPWSILQHAPKLHHMTLNVLPHNRLRLGLGLWIALQSLNLQGSLTDEQILDTLHHFPSLVHVRFSAWSFRPAPPIQPLSLPHLTSLNCEVKEEGVRILDYLILPSLKSLVIIGNGAAVETATSMIRRSACSLTHLSMNSALLFEHDIVRLLHNTPHLIELDVTSGNCEQRAVDRFLRALSNRSLIPHVERVCLERLREVSANLVTSFLEHRKSGGLKSCHLAFDYVSQGTMLWKHLKAAEPLVSFTYDDTLDLSASWSDEWGAVAV